MFNHYIATHPKSPFVNWIFLSAVTPEGRVNVMNWNVTFLRGADQSTATELADRAALRGLLAEHFGFDLPEVERCGRSGDSRVDLNVECIGRPTGVSFCGRGA